MFWVGTPFGEPPFTTTASDQDQSVTWWRMAISCKPLCSCEGGWASSRKKWEFPGIVTVQLASISGKYLYCQCLQPKKPRGTLLCFVFVTSCREYTARNHSVSAAGRWKEPVNIVRFGLWVGDLEESLRKPGLL